MASRNSLSSRFGWLVVLGVVLIAGTCMVSAQEAMKVMQNAPGFKSTMSYQNFDKGESVNVSNGGLMITHSSAIALPQNMGASLQPVRVYNSKDPDLGFENSQSTDLPYGFLGRGWTMTYGRVFMSLGGHLVYGTSSTYETRAFYFYQDESGAEHKLFRDGTMENWNPDGNPHATDWYFTCDSSFIRAKFTLGANGGLWTIYYPDGSVRSAGGTTGRSYIAPIKVGTAPNAAIQNQHTNGWYVTSIKDRAGNVITVEYRDYAPPAQPFGGSIMSVTDQFGRTIGFRVQPYGGLLYEIASGIRTEYYTVIPALDSGFDYPVLIRVTDPVGLETVYNYVDAPSAKGDPVVSAISYPTGAVSHYEYTSYQYLSWRFWANPTQSDLYDQLISTAVLRHTVEIRALSPSAYPNGADKTVNRYTWTYNMSWDAAKYPIKNPENDQIRNYKTRPVLVTDPMGGQTAYFITAHDNPISGSDVSGGKVLEVVRYGQGTTFNPLIPTAGRISQTDNFYAHGDRLYGPNYIGDSKRCQMDGVSAFQPNWQGNSRVWKTVEKSFLGTSWTKTAIHRGWDGFGHYGATQVSGTGLDHLRITVNAYDLKRDLNASPFIYQLDRATLSYTGEMTDPEPRGADIEVPDEPIGEIQPSEAATLTLDRPCSGTQNSYTSDSGLVYQQTAFKAFQTNKDFTTDSLALTNPTTTSNGDRVVTCGYNQGNVSQMAYSGGDLPPGTTAQTFTVSFTWAYGMASSMQWTGVSYPELTRSIDPATSRIVSQTEANGLTASYGYDDDGRLIAILPPGGEYGIRVGYPQDSTRGWTMGNRIRYYKGEAPVTFIWPDIGIPAGLLPGNDVSSLASDILYTDYLFDDLGRLWRTDTVMPDGTWSEKVTMYDPLGRAVFSSEPYAFGSKTVQAHMVPGLNPSGHQETPAQFTLNVPVSSGCAAFGTWDSPYASASSCSPFNGALEPFYRTQQMVKADGSYVSTTYSGLTNEVTLHGIATTLGPQDATTSIASH